MSKEGLPGRSDGMPRVRSAMKSKRKQLNRDLLDAVVMGNLAKVRLLLDHGADVEARDAEHQETPLILAVKFNQAGIVRLLLEVGARVEAKDDEGRTPLFFAPVSSEVFDVLLKARADPQVRDAEGNTILLRTMTHSPSLGEVEALLRLGIDASLRNNDGDVALDIAENLGLIKIVERLCTIA